MASHMSEVKVAMPHWRGARDLASLRSGSAKSPAHQQGRGWRVDGRSYGGSDTRLFWGKHFSPGIIIDCVEMDPETQERALLDGRIALGILVLTDRPILKLLSVQLLIEHAVTVALPKSCPQAALPEIRLPNLKEQPFIGLNRIYPAYGSWLHPLPALRVHPAHCAGGRRGCECPGSCCSRAWRRSLQRTD
jgi:hypothetical protein